VLIYCGIFNVISLEPSTGSRNIVVYRDSILTSIGNYIWLTVESKWIDWKRSKPDLDLMSRNDERRVQKSGVFTATKHRLK
jgi:hypothetical protein